MWVLRTGNRKLRNPICCLRHRMLSRGCISTYSIQRSRIVCARHSRRQILCSLELRRVGIRNGPDSIHLHDHLRTFPLQSRQGHLQRCIRKCSSLNSSCKVLGMLGRNICKCCQFDPSIFEAIRPSKLVLQPNRRLQERTTFLRCLLLQLLKGIRIHIDKCRSQSILVRHNQQGRISSCMNECPSINSLLALFQHQLHLSIYSCR